MEIQITYVSCKEMGQLKEGQRRRVSSRHLFVFMSLASVIYLILALTVICTPPLHAGLIRIKNWSVHPNISLRRFP